MPDTTWLSVGTSMASTSREEAAWATSPVVVTVFSTTVRPSAAAAVRASFTCTSELTSPEL